MSKVRRIDWSPSEWLAGTRGLGIDETAVYITVINIIYDRAAACPNDADFIVGQMQSGGSRQLRAGATKRTSRALGRLVDLGKLHVTPDGQGLTNGRAERELNKARERMRGAAQAGRASGRARTLNARSTHAQRHLNDTSKGSELSRTNDLGRTAVWIKQPSTIKDHDTVPTTCTDAARDPAPSQAPGRAPAKPTLEQLAKAARARLLKGET